jgi:hypothetical protein
MLHGTLLLAMFSVFNTLSQFDSGPAALISKGNWHFSTAVQLDALHAAQGLFKLSQKGNVAWLQFQSTAALSSVSRTENYNISCRPDAAGDISTDDEICTAWVFHVQGLTGKQALNAADV